MPQFQYVLLDLEFSPSSPVWPLSASRVSARRPRRFPSQLAACILPFRYSISHGFCGNGSQQQEENWSDVATYPTVTNDRRFRVSLASTLPDGTHCLFTRLRAPDGRYGPVETLVVQVLSELPRSRILSAELISNRDVSISVGTEQYLQPPGYNMSQAQVAAVHFSVDGQVR